MNAKHIFFVLAAVVLMMACGKGEKKVEEKAAGKDSLELKDGMLYGLACTGCNDTFVVIIPTGKLDGPMLRFNVQKAFKNNKLIGKLEPGDWCAILLNEKDKSVADMVINMDLVKGKWVHKVMPVEKENARALILLENPDANVDSIINSYMSPVERGFQLMRQGRAATVGTQYLGTLEKDDESIPVEYPAGSSYASWKVANGQIIFSEPDSIFDPNNKSQKIVNKNCERDTCDLVLLLKDSLQISYKGRISSYYRIK